MLLLLWPIRIIHSFLAEILWNNNPCHLLVRDGRLRKHTVFKKTLSALTIDRFTLVLLGCGGAERFVKFQTPFESLLSIWGGHFGLL